MFSTLLCTISACSSSRARHHQQHGDRRPKAGLAAARHHRQLDRIELPGRDLQEQSPATVLPGSDSCQTLERARGRRPRSFADEAARAAKVRSDRNAKAKARKAGAPTKGKSKTASRKKPAGRKVKAPAKTAKKTTAKKKKAATKAAAPKKKRAGKRARAATRRAASMQKRGPPQGSDERATTLSNRYHCRSRDHFNSQPFCPTHRSEWADAAMTATGFNDTVLFGRDLETDPRHVAIFFRRVCLAGFADHTGCRPGCLAQQRMSCDDERATARNSGKPSLGCGKDRRGRDHLCRPFDLLHRNARRSADRDRL